MNVVLHADDFGQSAAINAGVLRGFERELLTSASLLANAPAAADALRDWRKLSERHAAGGLASHGERATLDDLRRPFDLGVHLNLTQGRPLTGAKYPSELLDAAGRFPGVFWLFRQLRGRAERGVVSALRRELVAQTQFLLDHGIRPTHINGHQYIEMIPQVAVLIPELMEQFDIHVVRVAEEPGLVRTTLCHNGRVDAWLLGLIKRRYARQFRTALGSRADASPEAYFGVAHAGRINARVARMFLDRATKYRAVEIGMHPAAAGAAASEAADADGWNDPLAATRAGELALLEGDELPRLFAERGLKLGRLAIAHAA